MDNEKSHADELGCGQPGSVSVPIIGNWIFEKNFPYGFVIRNTKGKGEYHFWHDSNDWISVAYDGKPKFCVNGNGQGPARQMLCDKRSTQKMERIHDLKTKGNDLTHDEAKELLALCGLIKEEK